MRGKILLITVLCVVLGVSCVPSTTVGPEPLSTRVDTPPTWDPTSTADMLPTQDLTLAAAEMRTARAEVHVTMRPFSTKTPLPLTVTPFEVPTPAPLDIPIPVSSLPAMPPGVESRFGPGALPNGALARFGLGGAGPWDSEIVWRTEISPDGTLLAIGNAVGVYVYDLHTMEQLWAAPTRSVVDEIDWSPDSAHLAARLFEWKNLLIWDARSGDFQHSFAHEGWVYSMAWSPDSARIIAGFGGYHSLEEGYDNPFGAFAIWDIATGMRVLYKEYQDALGDGDYDTPVDIDWSPDGNLIAMLLGTNTVVLTDPASGEFVSVLTDQASMYEVYLKFSPDGRLLVAYSDIGHSDAPRSDGRAFVWDVAAHKQLYVLEHNGIVRYVLWSPDSSRLITSTMPGQGETRVWDMTNGDLFFTVLKGELVFGSIAWSSDSQRFISSHPLDGQAVVWDATIGKADWRGFKVSDLADFASPAYAGVAQDGSLLLWDSATGVPKVALRQIGAPLRIAWSPDLSEIAAIGGIYGREQPAIVWNIETGEASSFLGDTQELMGWHLSEGQRGKYDPECMVGSLVDPTGYSVVSFASQGEWYETITNTLSIYSAKTRETSVLEEEGPPLCVVAFSPDGSRLAVGHRPAPRGMMTLEVTHIDDAYIRIWDIATQTVLYTFYGHSGIVSDMLWSPDGSLLATASADGTIIIWPVR